MAEASFSTRLGQVGVLVEAVQLRGLTAVFHVPRLGRLSGICDCDVQDDVRRLLSVLRESGGLSASQHVIAEPRQDVE